MKIKEIKRTANVAWSPSNQYPTYLAAATAAQQLDSSFSTNACLELFKLDFFDNTNNDLENCGIIATNDRLHKLVWSPGVHSDVNLPDFLIGGAEQGRLYIWNPKNILCQEEPLVYLLNKHVGAVLALDVNPFQVNLLASGAGNSEIFIWDLNNPDKPMTPGSKAQPVHDVVNVAWNKQVQHILGSSQDGNCIVWDLRKNEPIIQIRDSMSKMKCSLMCWHPDVATQLCIASENDHTPALQLWDLRSAASPLKQFEGHNRGILSMAWCPQDSGLLLSCGKDNRILCWNPNSNHRAGEIVYELRDDDQWCFDVQWCPRNPGVISACSFGGHVNIHSITQGSQPITDEISDSFTSLEATSQQSSLMTAPKWMKKPCGASFGFGGKLATFSSSKGCDSEVVISQVVTEPLLVSKANELETSSLDSNVLIDFCDKKISDGSSGGDAVHHFFQIWNFLKVSLEEGGHQKYLKLLNIDLKNEVTGDSQDDDDDDVVKVGRKEDEFQIKRGVEESITKALLKANFEDAVDVCLRNELESEAMMLAFVGGRDLFINTQQAILDKKNSRLHKLISSIINHDIESVVSSYDIHKWDEVLMMILTYATPQELPSLCDLLGKRLEDEKECTKCQLCYIVAGNIKHFVSSLERSTNFEDHLEFQDVIDKVTILEVAQNSSNFMTTSCLPSSRLVEHAEILAEQGCATIALRHLTSLNDLRSAILKDRVFNSMGREFTSRLQPPPKPFHVVDIQSQQTGSQKGHRFVDQEGYLKTSSTSNANQIPQNVSSHPHSSNVASSKPPLYQPNYDHHHLLKSDAHQNTPPLQGQFNFPNYSDSLFSQSGLITSHSFGQNQPSVYNHHHHHHMQPPTWSDVHNSSNISSQIRTSDHSYQGEIYNPQDFHVENIPPPVVVAKEESKNLIFPEEHKVIKDVFDAVVQHCYSRATNMLTKKKLDDICKKLEVLYNRLAEGNVSPTIVAGIHQIICCLQHDDHEAALAQHARIAAAGNFSEISSFFPSIKMLIHTASQVKGHTH